MPFTQEVIEVIIKMTYLLSVVFFIIGLKKLSHPRTARQGNQFSMIGMLLAVVITLFNQNILSYELIIAGIVLGGIIGITMARFVGMTSMPQMIALLNGFGGAASTFVALAEYYYKGNLLFSDILLSTTLILSILIGTVTFSGSLVAFGKLQEFISGQPIMVTFSKFLNVFFLLSIIISGILISSSMLQTYILKEELLLIILGLSFILGITLVLPIGGADMPVVVSLLNSYSGIAVAMTGFVLNNNALIIIGSLVGASGIILTNIMCKGMNRSLFNVLFGGFGSSDTKGVSSGNNLIQGTVKSSTVEDAGMILDAAESVIIVPGYGMAVSQAQHQVKSLTQILEKRGVDVKFAIHPVAGRMPGHMNVLLAEAGIDYDKLYDMDQINDDFGRSDIAIVIGANDVVNPAAKDNPSSPIYGMPVLNVENAKTVFVLKRSMNPGFAGIDNDLFYKNNTLMVFGDAKKTVDGFILTLEELDS